jgi:hypothetical protein
MEDLRFEPPVNRLGQRIVVAVADTANRRFDPRRGQALRLADGQGLAAPVAVMNQSHCLGWTAFMDRLFQGIQDETRVRRGAAIPAASRTAGSGECRAAAPPRWPRHSSPSSPRRSAPFPPRSSVDAVPGQPKLRHEGRFAQ